ncbi:MAG: FixH family protein [Thermoactinomyces sp.]
MKRHYIFLYSILILLLVAACSPVEPTAGQKHPIAESHEHHHTSAPNQLDITFQSIPDRPVKNQPVELRSVVRSAEKPVTNAQVEYEVWKQGEKHELVKAGQQTGGIYTAKMNFPQDGQYHVIVHVTAPGVHQMISGSVTVSRTE